MSKTATKVPNRKEILENTARRCRERNIIIPTYEEMINPEKIPAGIKKALTKIGLWDVHPLNLFRISWKNQPVKSGGGFAGVNYLEYPRELTGVKARIITLLGKFFPTGSHKVGASFGPLVEKLVRGEFDPTRQKAVWPSTGNYCRGGAFNSALLACPAIAILPEGMSRERFDWLKSVGAEIFATPGGESNVKEIYDKCHELQAQYGDGVVILNQFDDFANPAWHYWVTGGALEEVFQLEKKPGQNLFGLFLTQGSAGTLASGDYLRKHHPQVKVMAGEALQCPTMLYNGYGDHRIEGIGDKHIPWVMNVRNLDLAAAIDDDYTLRVLRLFNEKAGHQYLKSLGLKPAFLDKLELLGISSIANLMGAIKLAKYYQCDENQIIFTVATDSAELYQSRLAELSAEQGTYREAQAQADYERCLSGLATDHVLEFSYWEKKRVHNLKYFTWVEQQGKTTDELNAQWEDPHYWQAKWDKVKEWEKLIRELNEKTGLKEAFGK